MRYFLDTEFIEYPWTIDLISLALVAEDGREYYAINRECDFEKANDWVNIHVISKLNPEEGFKTRVEIRNDILAFIGTDIPEFWGYYADYDWVSFTWLFGPMIDLPKGWPMYCRDIKQLCDDLGNPHLPMMETDAHHALADARANYAAWQFLNDQQRKTRESP